MEAGFISFVEQLKHTPVVKENVAKSIIEVIYLRTMFDGTKREKSKLAVENGVQ